MAIPDEKYQFDVAKCDYAAALSQIYFIKLHTETSSLLVSILAAA